MRKKMMVPVDFSPTAANAASYAIDFAESSGEYDVTVVHIFMPQVDAEYPNFVSPMPEYSGYRKKMMEDFLDSIQQGGVHHEIWQGFPADEIQKRSNQYDLIVMGTTGEGGLMNKLLGSVSGAVAIKANCPVLLVPEGIRFQPIYRVLYASHNDAIKPQALNSLRAFNEVVKAHIHFVHVRDISGTPFESQKEWIFRYLFENEEPGYAFDMAQIEGHSVADSLNSYARENHTEIIIVATHHRGFWEQLFHSSNTRDMISRLERPLLVFHPEE
jgi:nucleotide-binding universal stress UspA family protein